MKLVSKILEVNYEVSNADAIVVFSGDGYAGYENLGFQKRTLDVLKYYKSGYADKIYISSGKEQKISQVEINEELMLQNMIEFERNKQLNQFSNIFFNKIKVNYSINEK